jgi:methionine-rich copper-binding protein CopC
MIHVSDMSNKRIPRPTLRRIITAATGAAIALPPAALHAHAVIVAATPAVGADVAPGELDIRLEFNSPIDLDRSRLALRNPDNAQVPVVPASGGAALGANVLAGQARVGVPGRWTVHWQVLSSDGRITRGDIPFVVRPR